MKYDFPIIEHIDDVLPAIAGRDEFIVAEREGYKVVNYNVNFEDTFPPIKVAGGSAKMRAERSLHNALRRECRGIIFCSETGKILRRPYHKFFNVGEREETLPNRISLAEGHAILEKLDGSMIAPFYIGDEMCWGTKMGATDVAKPVTQFVMSNLRYFEFAEEVIGQGFTPIFEWCSRKQRIVIDHPEDRLILTAIRNIRTGEYMVHEKLKFFSKEFNIPVVDVFDPRDDITDFLEYTRGLQDTEGFVVRFDDGHMVKLKCDWYCQIHKAKEAILQDRNIVELILDNKLDDIKPHLLAEDVVRLDKFESDVNRIVTRIAQNVYDAAVRMTKQYDRKSFALSEYSKVMVKHARAIIFTVWDDPDYDRVHELVVKAVRNHLGRNTKWDEMRDEWFSDLEPYNA